MKFKTYKYEKPKIINKQQTAPFTAAFAGGGWIHLYKSITYTAK